MKPKNIVKQILDKKIIEGNTTVYKEDGNVFIKMKKSKFRIKIPKIDKNIAYLVGAIFGDGNISLVSRKDVSKYPRTKLRIYNASLNYVKMLNEITKKHFNICGRIYKREENCFILEFNNKIIWLYLSKIGNIKPHKKTNLKIPSILKSSTLFKHFIAGLMDTDGYFSRVFGIMMHGSNKEFLNVIKILSRKFYGLEFLGPYENTIIQDGKERYRVIMRLKTAHNGLFRKIIPLKHEKYGPEENRTPDLRGVFA